MNLETFAGRLTDRLRHDDFAEIDPSANGLQVAPDGATVEHAAFAVDAVAETMDAAVAAGADLLVTHHGISWAGGIERLTGPTYDRVATLVENDVALYVSHLPLDAHPELGNAAGVADVLSLTDRAGFAAVGPEDIGLRGSLPDPLTGPGLRSHLEPALDTGGEPIRLLDFGPDAIRDVAVVTGAGAEYVEAAAAVGADALVTGEGKGRTYHDAKEHDLTVLLAGHYATETFGVRSLQTLAEDWGLETTYLDRPTGL
mgnify:CR=1 FL=1